MPIWLQLVFGCGAVTIVVGFCGFVYGKLLKISGEVAVLSAWKVTVEARCLGHQADVGKIFDKIDGVKEAVAEKDTETARAIGCLEGKLEALREQ